MSGSIKPLHPGSVKALNNPATPQDLPTLSLSKSVHTPQQESDAQQKKLAHLGRNLATVAAAKQPQQSAQQSERWLNQFGTAQVTLGTCKGLKQFQGSLALLLPLDEADQKPLTFSQWHVQQQQGQTLVNIGLGQRYNIDGWLLGYNAFFDHNLRRSHSRLGLGSEAWTDYLQFSGNGYFPTSAWKKSPDVAWYLEKPATGFDIRAQGYWPRYPFIGGKIMYEHYFGSEVGLFGPDKRQKNPFAVTLGVNYTPLPLLTVGVDHRRGRQGKQDTRLDVQLKYHLAIPWQHHLAPGKVAQTRQLPMNLYAFVQRNNNIVLQYRKNNSITLGLPAELHGYPGDIKNLLATVEAALGLNRIDLQAPELVTAGGQIGAAQDLTYPITFPAAVGRYPVRGVAYDQQGNASAAAETVIVVDPCTTVQLQPHLVGPPGAVLHFDFAMHSQHGVPHFDWQGSDANFTRDGGSIDLDTGQITLPGAEANYRLSGVAIDPQNHRSAEAVMEIVVQAAPPAPIVFNFVDRDLNGAPSETQVVTIQLNPANIFREMRWAGTALNAAGAAIAPVPGDNTHYTLTLPNAEGDYVLTGTAVDTNGQQSQPVNLPVQVAQAPPCRATHHAHSLARSIARCLVI